MLDTIKTKYEELAQKKRAELEASLQRGDVGEPISGVVLSFAIGAALSAACGPIGRALLSRKEDPQHAGN